MCSKLNDMNNNKCKIIAKESLYVYKKISIYSFCFGFSAKVANMLIINFFIN